MKQEVQDETAIPKRVAVSRPTHLIKQFLRSREPRTAWIWGAIVTILSGLVFSICTILDFGGGSLSKGWDPGVAYLSFYGIFMSPLVLIIFFLTAAMCRLLGSGLIALPALAGLAALLIHGAVTSRPGAQLGRVTDRKGIPKLVFEKFEKRPSFNDGTAYVWIVRCSDREAEDLVASLGLTSVPHVPNGNSIASIPVVAEYEGWFRGSSEGVRFFTDRRGMIGGFSHAEQRFRIVWWPAACADFPGD